MLNIKTKGFLTVGIWVLYVILSFIYYPKIISMISTSGFGTSVSLYLLTNPAYLLLIYYIISTSHRKGKSVLKAIVASILLIISFDLVASPRVEITELFTTGSATITNMGAIAIKAMSSLGLSPTFAWYLYYLILPIILFMFSVELLGFSDFIRKFKKGGV